MVAAVPLPSLGCSPSATLPNAPPLPNQQTKSAPLPDLAPRRPARGRTRSRARGRLGRRRAARRRARLLVRRPRRRTRRRARAARRGGARRRRRRRRKRRRRPELRARRSAPRSVALESSLSRALNSSRSQHGSIYGIATTPPRFHRAAGRSMRVPSSSGRRRINPSLAPRRAVRHYHHTTR